MSDATMRNRRGKKKEQAPRAGESPAVKAEMIPVLKPAEDPTRGIRVTAAGPVERAGHVSPSRPGQHEEIIERPPLITQEVNKWRYEHPWQTQQTQPRQQPATQRQQPSASYDPQQHRGSWTTTPTGMPIYQLVQQQTERAVAGVRDRVPASIPAAADAARARAGSALEAASRMPPLSSGAVPVPSVPLEKVGPVLLAAAAVLASGLRNMLTALGEYVPALAAEVEEVAPQVLQSVEQGAAAARRLGQEGYYRVQEALPVVGERLGAAAQGIPQAARRTGQAVASTAGSVAHTVSDATGNVAHAVGDVTGSVAQSVGNLTGNIVHSVEDAAGNVIHTVTDTTGNVIHTFVETASAVRERLAGMAQPVVGGRYQQKQQQQQAPFQQQRMQLYRTDEQLAADQRGIIATAIDAVKSVLPAALGGTTTTTTGGRGIVSKVGDLVTLRPLTAAWRGESTTSGTRSSTGYLRRRVNLGRGVQPLPIKPARGSHFARPHTDKLMWAVPTGEGVGEWASLAKSQRGPVHVRHSQDDPIAIREGGKRAKQPLPQQKQAQFQQQQFQQQALGGAGTGGQYSKQGIAISQAVTHPEPSMPFPAASSFATPGLASLSSGGLPVSPAEPAGGVQRAL